MVLLGLFRLLRFLLGNVILVVVIFLLLVCCTFLELLQILIKFLAVVPVKPGGVSCLDVLDPSLVDVLVSDEGLDLLAAGTLSWLVVPPGQLCLPIRVNYRVVQMLVHLNHLRLPLIQVDTLDLGDVHLKLPVLAGASQANKGPKGD